MKNELWRHFGGIRGGGISYMYTSTCSRRSCRFVSFHQCCTYQMYVCLISQSVRNIVTLRYKACFRSWRRNSVQWDNLKVSAIQPDWLKRQKKTHVEKHNIVFQHIQFWHKKKDFKFYFHQSKNRGMTSFGNSVGCKVTGRVEGTKLRFYARHSGS